MSGACLQWRDGYIVHDYVAQKTSKVQETMPFRLAARYDDVGSRFPSIRVSSHLHRSKHQTPNAPVAVCPLSMTGMELADVLGRLREREHVLPQIFEQSEQSTQGQITYPLVDYEPKHRPCSSELPASQHLDSASQLWKCVYDSLAACRSLFD